METSFETIFTRKGEMECGALWCCAGSRPNDYTDQEFIQM